MGRRSAPGTPSSGFLSCWFDSTATTELCKDSSGNVYAAVKTASGATANQWVTHIDGNGVQQKAQPTEANLSTSDIATNNVSSTKHGLAPKSPADGTQFLNGAATPSFAAVKDADVAFTDVTTNNVSATKHGYVPKIPADATK